MLGCAHCGRNKTDFGLLRCSFLLALVTLVFGCATPVKVQELRPNEVLMEHMKMEGFDRIDSEHVSLTIRANPKWRTEHFTRSGAPLQMIYNGAATANIAFGTNRAPFLNELSFANHLAFMRTFGGMQSGNLREYYKYSGVVQSNGIALDRYRGRASNLAAGQQVDVERSSGHVVAIQGSDDRGGEYYRFDYFPLNSVPPDDLFKTNAPGVHIPALLNTNDSRTFNDVKAAMEARWKARSQAR